MSTNAVEGVDKVSVVLEEGYGVEFDGHVFGVRFGGVVLVISEHVDE